MKHRFAKVFDYPETEDQILVTVEIDDDETHRLKLTTLSEKFGATVTLSVGGWKERERATKNMDNLDAEKARGLFNDLMSEFISAEEE